MILRGLSNFGSRWGALIVAVLALAVSLWSAYEDRRHKRLSVRPQLLISFNYNQTKSEANWILTNSGLGPAIVERFEVYVDDKPQESWEALANAIGFAGPRTFGFSHLYSHQNVPAAFSVNRFNVNSSNGFEAVARNWERVRMEVCYCSLYEECRVVSSRKESERTVRSCELPRFGETTWHGNARLRN
jgi:hypothetical protein